MKNTVLFVMSFVVVSMFTQSCTSEAPTDLAKTSFIPKPVSVTATGNSFKLSEAIVISASQELQTSAEYLSVKIEEIAGFKPAVQTAGTDIGVLLQLSANDNELGNEGYTLKIDKKLITISANQPAGIINGIQTLLQTLPVKSEAAEALKIATGEIRDHPQYGYRGAMLDVARHFFTVEEVKQFIDYLTMYKMNVLHFHLSDDQGWRIEIKSWPKLTEIGGGSEVGGGSGGFYTQAEYSDLVKYAQDRNVTIVPEIDMPGHTNAALASYPELNCDGKARELYSGIEVGFSTLCTDKEITYQFIDDVVRELAALTPGEYIHIGGDESHATPLEDYIPFVERVQEIVVKHGKKVLGWDEIAKASLVENSAVQFWADVKNANLGLEKGAKVLISPAKKAYLDMKYDSTSTYGLKWAGYGIRWNKFPESPKIR